MFENGEKIAFATKDLSNVSFMNTDITRVKFSEDVNWGETDRSTVIDERDLGKEHLLISWDKLKDSEEKLLDFLRTKFGITIPGGTQFEVQKRTIYNKKMESANNSRKVDDRIPTIRIVLNYRQTAASLSINGKPTYTFIVRTKGNEKNVYSEYSYSEIEGIKAIYRNLRENYEYRLRYDEAGQFFFKEMELKRNYHQDSQGNIKKTDLFRKNVSLTGFYHLASYGEKVRMPFHLMGITIVLSFLTSLYYFHPTYYPSLDYYDGLSPLGNATERSFTVFLQLRNENFVWLDYIYKALGILSLGLLAIPLRRKFERKFRH